ncbi:MAG: hypothetical protein IJI37_07250 [Opitutales bacterium]|nr:hypothetical protein [Opitutales bacterium]
MSVFWQSALWLGLSLASAAGGAALAAMSYAAASLRFLNLRGGELPKRGRGFAGMFLAGNSRRVASSVALGRKFFCAFSAAAMYLAASPLCGESGVWKTVLAAASAALAVFLQYCVFEIPATRIGRNYPLPTVKKLGAFAFAVYAAFLPLELAARFLVGKILPERLRRLESGFDYIDVAMILRADENEAEAISPYTGKIVRNAFRLQELDVSDAMIPRTKIEYFDTEKSNSENLKLALGSHHTRYPLCNGGLDDCVGIMHIKDVFTAAAESGVDSLDFRALCRQTIRVRENEKLEGALAKLLKYKLQMALVEDSFGGVIGVLTLDAALGELVGPMRGDFGNDRASGSIRVVGRNRYKIAPMTALRRVEDFLDVDFDTDEVSTFGGLVTFLLGRFPEKGERLHIPNPEMTIVIDSVGEKTVGECTVILEDSGGD